MIGVIEGPMGSGKTLTLVALGWVDFQAGRKVFSNFYTTFSEELTPEEIARRFMSEDFDEATFLLDEGYLWADSRRSQARSNQLVNSFVYQTRKMGVDLYAATHFLDHMDLRFRRAVSLRMRPYFNRETGICRVAVMNRETGTRMRFFVNGPTHFDLYDTRQRVNPTVRIRKSLQF